MRCTAATNFAICHTITNSSSTKQQQLQVHKYMQVDRNTYSYVVQQRTV